MVDILPRISFNINGLADLVFALVSIVSLSVSLILFYHWKKYGMGGKGLALAEFIYLVVTASLLAAAFLSIK